MIWLRLNRRVLTLLRHKVITYLNRNLFICPKPYICRPNTTSAQFVLFFYKTTSTSTPLTSMVIMLFILRVKRDSWLLVKYCSLSHESMPTQLTSRVRIRSICWPLTAGRTRPPFSTYSTNQCPNIPSIKWTAGGILLYFWVSIKITQKEVKTNYMNICPLSLYERKRQPMPRTSEVGRHSGHM